MKDENKYLIVHIESKNYQFALRTPLVKDLLKNDRELDFCLDEIKRALLKMAIDENKE